MEYNTHCKGGQVKQHIILGKWEQVQHGTTQEFGDIIPLYIDLS